MDLQDMEKLIRAYDAMREIEDAVEVICGGKYGEGALGELDIISEVMMKYSVCIDERTDPDHKVFWKVLDDDSLSSGERAEKLMGKA